VPLSLSGAIRRASSGLALGAALVVWLFLLGPLAALARHLSFGEIHQAFAPPASFDPLVVSLEASAVALALIVAGGTPLAYLLARQRLPCPRLVEIGLVVPLLMPPLVIGLLLVFLFGGTSTLGQGLAHLGLSATNTFLALVLAEIYEAAPYYILGAYAAFSSVDRRYEELGLLLGDRPLQSIRRITVPLASPGLAMALATSWARAMGAFGAVIIVAYHPYGLPMQIWVALEEVGLSGALPYALLLLVAAIPLPILAYLWSARARSRWGTSAL